MEFSAFLCAWFIDWYLDKVHKVPPLQVITGCVKNDPNGPMKPLAAGGQAAPPLPFKSVHPLFMAGAGYVVSGDLLTPLYTASLDIRLVRVEDAFLTGYCARRVGGVKKVSIIIIIININRESFPV